MFLFMSRNSCLVNEVSLTFSGFRNLFVSSKHGKIFLFHAFCSEKFHNIIRQHNHGQQDSEIKQLASPQTRTSMKTSSKNKRR
uniref:Uncharacterized protein n=1 Tax=Arundo donax TaxID=35708 RepID=A0A0A9BID7_ARUDO